MRQTITSLILCSILTLLFSDAVFAQPANNNCANAAIINTDSACVTGTSRLTGQTISLATVEGAGITSSCGTANSQDVWYKFKAKTSNPTITVSALGTSWGTSLRIQLFSGTCGSFVEKGCATNAPLTPSLTNSLMVGDTHYIRIHKNNATAPTGTNWGYTICVTDPLEKGSRMNEVFSLTVLSPAGVMQYPWEVTYGNDDHLWITEARGYKVYRMDPNTGVKTTVLDLASGSTFLPSPQDTLNAVSMGTWAGGPGGWPQGGFAGMAMHPEFSHGVGKDYVYVTYIHRYLGGVSPTGIYYRNKLVRFTYNSSLGRLEAPAVLANSLPGSKDHNSQRMIIAPITKGGTPYLFYACGDMGSGQFENRDRPIYSQDPTSLEGKILRYNVDTVGGLTWIPTTNPYSSTSPVYNIGIRNNQGFAYDTSTNILYGSSHGAYSDDEINIIEPNRNYGHPLVIGYADGNYNGTTTPSTNTSVTAGAPFTNNMGNSTCIPIGNEVTRMGEINIAGNGAYKGPLFSAYATPNATIQNTWRLNTGNANWWSEGWSGMDLYASNLIPTWKRSLALGALKWGRVIKLQLGENGTTTLPSNLDSLNSADTIAYFQSVNRYRDLAFSPDGKDIFLVMDNNSATSGPGVGNPIVPACAGCVVKYSFLGYSAAAAAPGVSMIPKTIPVATGSAGCTPGTTVTIDGSNNWLWVPITGPDGNILAEINAMGQNLGAVTSSFYKPAASDPIRVSYGVHYLDRNITITPTITSFATPVRVRLYISKAEYDSLAADPFSGITNINLLRVLKNNDPVCNQFISSNTTLLTPTNTLAADLQHGANGYVLQVNVSSFSTFFFASSSVVLPVSQLTLTGKYQNGSALLQWKTETENNSSHFVVERSLNGHNFNAIGSVNAAGTSNSTINYPYTDINASKQSSLILYYRLRIVDLDGTYKYSNVVSISLPAITGGIKIIPNPAFDKIKVVIQSPADTKAEWRIIDNTGRNLLHETTLLNKGNNELFININNLATGSYYFMITGEGIESRSKFQKL